MKANELRKKYLEFFKAKGHSIIPSASLIPENDPSVLFTTAGMHPIVPFLMGEKHPAGKRLVSCQKCIRTGDIDEVGDNFHLTFFEMLGNWSLGDYWKQESITWSWEFLTDKRWLNLNVDKLAVTVFSGDDDCPFDEESYNFWIKHGVKPARIAKLGKDDNWWPAGGKSTGPQGPDTEIFYWTGKESAPAKFDPNDKRWCEIWNNVFMEFERTEIGEYRPLKQKNVDTGMGLERTAAVLEGKTSVYETELFEPLINAIKFQIPISKKQTNSKFQIPNSKPDEEKSIRIIADHLRSAIMIMADDCGFLPSNLKQGYVVRKLVRRAIRHAKKIGIPTAVDVITPIVELVADSLKDVYPELLKNKQRIAEELNREEKIFEKTLTEGEKRFITYTTLLKHQNEDTISGKEAFNLYTTYGLPLEYIEELAKEKGLNVDKGGFYKFFNKHQELSHTASAGQFKGGLVSQSEMTIKYHTATHLLHQALRQILGNHVEQKGSNITDERLRFDFSHPEKMTAEQIMQVQDLVNQKIKENLPVCCEVMTAQEAKSQGAIGLFADKYGQQVKVYTVGNASSGCHFSREICGGPHVGATGELGHFKIIKEEASSKGVRRIKAILE